MNVGKNINGGLDKLKKELKELIDHRIAYNNGFSDLLRGDYSLFVSLIFLFLSYYGARKFEFFMQHYVLSVYFLFIIWFFYALISTPSPISTLKHIITPMEGDRGSKDIINTHPGGLIDWLLKVLPEKRDIWKKDLNLYFKQARPIIYSAWILFLLSIPMLFILQEKRIGLWVPAIVFVFYLPFLAEKGEDYFTNFLDSAAVFLRKKQKEHGTTMEEIIAIFVIASILIIGIYFCYRIVIEIISIVWSTPSSIFYILLTMILIWISLASLSEYLSMKFIIADVSQQNYALSVLWSLIDRIEDVKILKDNKKEILGAYLPSAESFSVFFIYYHPVHTPHTFEVSEEKEGEESNL